MTREIKFRYWDIINETMIEDAHLLDSLSEKIARPREYHVMQYTGLKDRNGKDIYDKDIVKLCYGIPPTFDTLLIEYADDETVGYISVSGWWMRNIRKNGTSGSLCKTYENDLEIIGDIHTTPELLEGKT